MSKIRLHGSSSGYTEIAPVAASGNNTLTLPNDGTIISKDSNGAVGVTSITVGTGVTVGDGRVTATSFVGSGANLTGITAGITMVDSWVVDTSYFQDGGNADITSNWVRHALGSSNLGNLGSNMSESSGIFTFPSTGIYMVTSTLAARTDGGAANYAGIRQYFSNNSGSSYSTFASGYGQAYTDTAHFCVSQTVLYDVANVSTARIKFNIENSSRIKIFGNATNKNTGVVFVRLGDT